MLHKNSSTRRRVRFALEGLEDRAVPADFTASTVPELIADINAANALGGQNTITLAPGARFTLTAVNNGGSYYGDFNGLPVVAAGDALTIVGNGDVIERSTATGTPEFRFFVVAAGGSLTLTNLTLQGGRVTASDNGVAAGGAVFNHGALTLAGVTVQNNVAAGPGWYAAGGGIWSDGALTLSANTVVRNNQVVGGRAELFYLRPLVQFVTGSGLGGGIYVAGGTASLTGVTLSGNIAQGGR